MHITNFETLIREHMRVFVINWMNNNLKNPDEYPIEMNPTDWIEHFLIYLECPK